MSDSSQSASKIAVVILPAPCARLDLEAQLAREAGGRLAVAQIGVGDLARPAARDAASRAASRSDSRANGGCQRNLMLAKRDLLGADRLPRRVGDQLFGHAHQRVIVGVGLVELHHRELGVVLRRNPLVPEVAVDLEHPLEAADREPLQVQLRRDAQVEIHVERVVMGRRTAARSRRRRSAASSAFRLRGSRARS